MGTLTDIGLVVFLVLQVWLGWRSGLLWQVTAMASLCIGIILGATLSPLLSEYLIGSVTRNPFHAQMAAFLFVAGVVGLMLRLIATYAEVLTETGLAKEEREQRRGHDRVLGGIFGALKGSIIALLLVAILVSIWPQNRIWQSSNLARPFAKAGARMLPEGALAQMHDWMKNSTRVARHSLQIRLAESPEEDEANTGADGGRAK